MITYSQFKKMDIDLSPLGFQMNGDFECYYCTPKKANILGISGVDGIHYCTIPGFGELIFAISPMNFGDCVHPIARSFEDLLRLLLSCVDMAALEQCYAWDEEQYKAFLIDCPATEEQREVLDSIRNILGLMPIENAFSYVKELQAEFDLSKIPYTDDYYDEDMNPTAPKQPQPIEWKVYYGGGNWIGQGKGRPGKEITLNSQFSWGDEIWHIPAIYSCSKGLVVDFCVEIQPERMKVFLDKWLPVCEDNFEISHEMQEKIDRENPMSIDFRPYLRVNGKDIKPEQGSSVTWIPQSCTSKEYSDETEARHMMTHYGLDETKAWTLHRWSCPWATLKKPVIKSLKLRLERSPESINGIHFKNPAVGDVITFEHPVTHIEHKLTVMEYEKQELSPKTFASEEYEFPTHHTMMTYTVEPELSNKNFQIRDCLDNDEARHKPKKRFEPQGTAAACIGIIGSADGPTAIILSNGSKVETATHATFSALHFEPIDDIEWRMVFCEKLMEDVKVELIR